MELKDKAQAFAVKKALEYLDKDPETNLPKDKPFNNNMLRPCPVLDNPGRLTDIVERSGAKSTDYQNLESVKEFPDKCVDAAANWTPVADRLWMASKGAACEGCGRVSSSGIYGIWYFKVFGKSKRRKLTILKQFSNTR